MTWTIQIGSPVSRFDFQSFAECEEALGQWSMLLDGGRFCNFWGYIYFSDELRYGFSISNGYNGSKLEIWEYTTSKPI